MSSKLPMVLISLCLMLLAGCSSAGNPSASSATSASIDQSSPRAAMRSFWNAIDQGDARAARQVCLAGRTQSAWIDAFAAMCGGWRKLNDARVRKFGDEGTVHQTPAYTSLALADKMVVQENNGQATLVMPGHPELATFVVKNQGKWFLDMNRSMGGDPAATTKIYQSIAAAANAVAASADAGKYATDDAAESAFKNAIAERLNLPQHPVTQPAR